MTKTTWRLLGCKKRENPQPGEKPWVFDEELAKRDIAACRVIHAQQVEKYGRDMVGDEPDLLKWPVWIALIAERAGAIVDYFYMECELEGCMGGCDTRAAASLRRFAPVLIDRAKAKGFRFTRVFVPRVVEATVGNELERAGFKQQDEMYAHFLLDLR